MMHSKVIATLIICFALIASTLVYNKKNEIFGQNQPITNTVTVDNSTSVSSLPTNIDWKKSLTTVTNEPIKILTKSTDEEKEDNTATAQMAKTFFSLYLADQKNGVVIDDAEAIRIADQTLSQIKIPGAAKQYTPSNLRIIADSSETALKTWASGVSSTIQANFSPTDTSDLIILTKALQTQKESDLARLDPVIKSYQKTIQTILSLPVPQKIAPYALVYINTLSSILFDLQGMRQSLTDPGVGYIYFTTYQKDTDKLKIIIEKIMTDFGR